MAGRTLPVVRNWLAGEIDTGAYMNAIAAWMRFTQTPPATQLTQSVAQSLPTGTATAILMDTEGLDTDGGHSLSTNTSRYTCQVAGWYLVSAVIPFSTNGTGLRNGYLAVNGTRVPGTTAACLASTTDVVVVTVPASLTHLNVGDYVEVLATQASGGALNTFIEAGGARPAMSILRTSL